MLHEQIEENPFWANLRRDKNRLVPGEGNAIDPMVMVIGGRPGAQEAMKLRPFVGPSGVMLRRLMDSAGLIATPTVTKGSEEHPETQGIVEPNCWLTNVVKYRPPRNRTPYWQEIQEARKDLRHEWVCIGRPPIIICVGATAWKAIVPKDRGLLESAGQLYMHFKSNRKPQNMAVWPMIHPGLPLRDHSYRDVVEKHWEDLGEWLWETGVDY
jgi:DNA polymerase